ncbi:MAG TPA: hypothetical protein VIK01_29145 [Polyangiaceae bacterium]
MISPAAPPSAPEFSVAPVAPAFAPAAPASFVGAQVRLSEQASNLDEHALR